jgi:predicted ribosomally synthesized peptide with SipW-like signal peptide
MTLALGIGATTAIFTLVHQVDAEVAAGKQAGGAVADWR